MSAEVAQACQRRLILTSKMCLALQGAWCHNDSSSSLWGRFLVAGYSGSAWLGLFITDLCELVKQLEQHRWQHTLLDKTGELAAGGHLRLHLERRCWEPTWSYTRLHQ